MRRPLFNNFQLSTGLLLLLLLVDLNACSLSELSCGMMTFWFHVCMLVLTPSSQPPAASNSAHMELRGLLLRNVVSSFFLGGGGCSDHFIAGGVTQRWFPCVHSTASVVWSPAVSLKGVWILFPFTAFKKTKIQGNCWLSAACLLSWERSCLCDTKQRLFSHPLTIKGGDGSSSQIFRLRLHFVTKTRA